MKELYFIHRIDINVGDILSGPYRYWDWGVHEVIDICDTDRTSAIPEGSHVIIGGGGLLSDYFSGYIRTVMERKPSRVVWWGVGERRIQDTASAYLPPELAGPGIRSDEFPPDHLVGVRSMSPWHYHVPCSSCKYVSDYLSRHSVVTRQDVGIFEHGDIPMDPGLPFPRISNRACSPEEAMDFIASTSILVTNSYHGMYWGAMLGKKVICVPFSSGLYKHPWDVTHCTREQLPDVIEAARREASPDRGYGALQLALANNEMFRKKVLEYL